MDVVAETSKRLAIAKNISKQLEGIVKCVVLGGSMGFGQNYCITEKSDIDMVVVCDKRKIRDLEATSYFSGSTPSEVLKMFEDGVINLFWVTKEVDAVEVNSFIYETQGYKQFCLLKGKLKGYLKSEPSHTQDSYRFDGEKITFDRNVTAFGEGFLYEKPALVDGRFWGGPPRSNFLMGAYPLYQERNFFDNLRGKVLNATIKQLIKEYGSNPDLSRVNILNTDYVFQKNPTRLPKEAVEKLKRETEERLRILK